MKREKIIVITLALLIAVPFNALDFNSILNNSVLTTSDYNSISTTNPFDVHTSTGPNRTWDIYLTAGIYFLDIATSAPFESYYNVTFTGNGFNEKFFTNNYEFHGVSLNKSGIYSLNSVGSGKWMFSLFAQDPNKIYSFQLSSSESFVIVPNIDGSSEIRIGFENNESVNVTIFDELLESIYSAKSIQDGTLHLNLSGDYEGILFLLVSPESNNTNLSFSWIPVQNNNPQPTISVHPFGLYYLEIVLVVAAIIGAVTLLYKTCRKK